MEYLLHTSEDRGKAEHGWLHSRFSFSFAEWFDMHRMGFGLLRVINDDRIDPDSGFGLHPHKDMEIITIVMKGTVTHGDSMGNHTPVSAGEVQVMSAGTGVVHSEYNHSPDTALELFQIWILPRMRNIAPRYDQKSFGVEWKPNTVELLVSPDARDGSLMIHQDAFVSRASFASGELFEYVVHTPGKNGVYIFVVEGSIAVGEYTLGERDALGVVGATSIKVSTLAASRILFFEVPMG